MSREEFQRIPAVEITSVPQAAFYSWRKNEMTQDEYFITNAIWVSDNTEKYRPHRYYGLTDQLRTYVDQRLKDTMSRDPSLSKRLGLWVYMQTKAHVENASDFELIVWCMAHLERAKLSRKVSLLAGLAEEYARNQFPREDFSRAAEVMKRDSAEKVRARA